MAESHLHKVMKSLVAADLETEGYAVFLEPSYSPVDGVNWGAYRPDIFAIRLMKDSTEFVLVECETNPSRSRLHGKNIPSLRVQSKLMSADRLRRILAIPPGMLRRVDQKSRRRWEIWVVGFRAPLVKYRMGAAD